MSSEKTVGSLLLEYEMINEDDLKEALALQRESGRRLGEILVEMGKITNQDIEYIISKHLDIPFIIIDDKSIDTELLNFFPREFLLQHSILPMYQTDDEIAIVTGDPFNKDAFESIEKLMGRRVNLSAGNAETITTTLKHLFRKEGAPELIHQLDKIVARIKDTCLYRLDFIQNEHGFFINAFGGGILKNMASLEDPFKRDDVFVALNAMDMPIIYEELEREGGFFISACPVLHKLKHKGSPVVLGRFGLGIRPGISFCDTPAYGIPGVFIAGEPVDGYSFMSMKRRAFHSQQTVFTLDSAPKDFKGFYVDAFIPLPCKGCGGEGCGECDGLGHKFKKVEGVHSSDDLIKLSKEE